MWEITPGLIWLQHNNDREHTDILWNTEIIVSETQENDFINLILK